MRLTGFKSFFLIASTIVCSFTASAQKNNLVKNIDELMKTSYADSLPGASVLVALDDKIIFQKAYGKASLASGENITPRHIFRIGSITKQFTSAAILRLVAQGKINLSDPVVKFIPEYAQGTGVTIRHLLTHTAGVENYTGIPGQHSPDNKIAEKTVDERFAVFRDRPLEFQPGEIHRYSNSGYFLLGMIIEKVSGIPYGKYLEKEFFSPLEMRSTCYDGGSPKISPSTQGYVKREGKFVEAGKVHHSMPFSAGSVASTADDLFKWSRAIFSFGLLPENLMTEAWKPARLNSGKEVNYGFGWSLGRLDELKVIYHGGAIDGFVGYVLNIPEKKLFVAILTNKNEYGVIAESEKIARIVLDKPVRNPPAIPLAAEVLEEYAGVYKNDDDQIRVIMRSNDRLFSKDAYGDSVQMMAYKTDGFFLKDMPVKLDFERRENGEIHAVTITGTDWLTAKEVRLDSSLAPQRKIVKLQDSLFEKYTGEYEISSGFIIKVWRDRNDRYMVTSFLHGDFEIFAETETKFFIPDAGVDLQFVNDEQNAPALIVMMGGKTNRGRKIK